MINALKYKEQILKALNRIDNECFGFGYNPKKDTIMNCLSDNACKHCLFKEEHLKYSENFCAKRKYLWLITDDDNKSIE